MARRFRIAKENAARLEGVEEQLVGIEGQGVRAPRFAQAQRQAFAEHREGPVGAVDVEPQAFARAQVGDGPDGASGHGPRRRHDAERIEALATVPRDGFRQAIHPHAELLVHPDPAHALDAEPEERDRLVDGSVHLLRRIDEKAWPCALKALAARGRSCSPWSRRW